ncbi:MAG: hypothetical protein CVV07_07210 [Gammaproteobacteria bacterium HGW-Gammaproteobacteria-11]|nr:MAG: hypothetical protein CVV07_07210 [Gammaproteobacteria bacterium HGW-Gammaproteobacteria-11]
MINFIHTTGAKEFLPPEHQERRFEVVRKPSIHSRALDLQRICDICNRARNQGNHQKCSKLRQAMNRSKSQ